MPKLKERLPADFVRMPATDEQLLGLWSRVERGEARRRARARHLRRAATSGAVLAVLVGALALTWLREESPVAAGGPAIENAASGPRAAGSDPSASGATSGEPRELSLADGSHLSLSAGARARVLVMRADEVRVRLERGRVDCDVEPVRERRFVVEAGAFEVIVTGTRFSVEAGGDGLLASSGALASSLAVGVERGSVEVREPSGRLLAALTAGQRWASEHPAPPVEAPDAGPAATPESPAAQHSELPRSIPPQSAPTQSAPLPSRVAPSVSSSAAGPGAAPRSGPVALLARASEARQAGKMAEASAALEELLQKYPGDERAGYAAFLLGRIQLDGLGDAPAAVEAFSFAVAHPGSGFFAEDAEARQIEALARAGQMTECARVRDRFLAKYPRAARAASVREACRAK